MMEASACLKGKHDWESFSKPSENIHDYTSEVFDVLWTENHNELYFQITAIRFFHSMIRLLMGTLLDVGRGRLTPFQFKEILEARDLSQAGAKAPACGLYLVHVQY